jgi:type II secretory pathway pseudopilin PulG
MRSQSGMTLMEVIVATLVAILAVLGLAYSFGTGRALINRYETARSAEAAAVGVLDSLSTLPRTDPALTTGIHSRPFAVAGNLLGTTTWDVELVDAATGGPGADLKKVGVTVGWTQGSFADSVQVSRLFPIQ